MYNCEKNEIFIIDGKMTMGIIIAFWTSIPFQHLYISNLKFLLKTKLLGIFLQNNKSNSQPFPFCRFLLIFLHKNVQVIVLTYDVHVFISLWGKRRRKVYKNNIIFFYFHAKERDFFSFLDLCKSFAIFYANNMHTIYHTPSFHYHLTHESAK